MSTPPPPLPANAPKSFTVWKHYKGGLYTVLGTGYHSENLEPMVIYTHDGDVWCRPLKMWNEKVGEQPRFVEMPNHLPARSPFRE